MTDRKTAIEEMSNKLCLIPKALLSDKDRTVGEMLDDMEAYNDAVTSEAELVVLLNEDPVNAILTTISQMETACEAEIRKIDKEAQPILKERLEGKLEGLVAARSAVGQIHPLTRPVTHVSRPKVHEAEKILLDHGVNPDDVSDVLDQIAMLLLKKSLYINDVQTANIVVSPI